MKRRLVLHVGLPKTATSTIQSWAYGNREWLLRRGVDYPEDVQAVHTPKHQWLVESLMGHDMQRVELLGATNQCPTLFLSTEGLTNHFEDFHPDQLKNFQSAFSDREITLVVTARDQQRWLKSYYWQCAMNPPVDGMPYAGAESYESFIALGRVQRLSRLMEEPGVLQHAFAATAVEVLWLEHDWQSRLLSVLGVAGPGDPPPFSRQNATIDMPGLDIVLLINRAGLQAEVRASLLALLGQVVGGNHAILGSYRLNHLHLPLCHELLLKWIAELPATRKSIVGSMLAIVEKMGSSTAEPGSCQPV